MELTYERIEEYLKKLGKNYSMVFTFEKHPINQLKIHYAPHVGEFYYSYRNRNTINPHDYNSVTIEELKNISFFAGLLVSSFDKQTMHELLDLIEKNEHFPIHNPEVLSRTQAKKEEDQKDKDAVKMMA